jgi:hypothetical protein
MNYMIDQQSITPMASTRHIGTQWLPHGKLHLFCKTALSPSVNKLEIKDILFESRLSPPSRRALARQWRSGGMRQAGRRMRNPAGAAPGLARFRTGYDTVFMKIVSDL